MSHTGTSGSPLSQDIFINEGDVHNWSPECGNIHSVETGAEAQGMESPPRGYGTDLRKV